MNSDGSNPANVTNSSSIVENNPSWSPDGTKLVYEAGKLESSEIWVMNIDGSNKTQLTKNNYNDGSASYCPVKK